MFPSEMVILMAIAKAGDSGEKLLRRPMDVVGEYIGYLYNSLATRGYIQQRNSSGECQLTIRGKRALFDFLHENKARVNDTIKTLQQLGIRVSPEDINKLEKEVIKVK